MFKLKQIINISCFFMIVACSKGDGTGAAGGEGIGGSTARMTISGNYLYIVSATSLFTYDITDPATTILLSEENLGWGNIETIFPYRDKLFIGSQRGMFVYDKSDPKKPKLQGQAQHFRACDPVVADDDFAYVTLRNNNQTCGGTLNQLQIYDIQGTNILTPKMIATLDMPEPNGLGYHNNTLYICMGGGGLNVVDVTNRQQPKSVKTVMGAHFIDVIPYDDVLIAYINGGFLLYDISNPANPQPLSTIQN